MQIVVQEWERVLLHRDGRFEEILGTGRHRRPRWRRRQVRVQVRPRLLVVPSQEVLSADGLSVKASLTVAREAAAFRASDSEVYYVALRFGAAGGGDEIGVWTTDSLAVDEAVSTVLSVAGFAKQFTVWPDAEAAFDICPAHPSVDGALDCLG